MKHKYMKQSSSTTPKRYDRTTIGALAEAFDKSFITIVRWIAANDDRLTSDKAQNVYRSVAQRKINTPAR